MAVNQPKISKDQADNSWKLEVTTQANNEEARVNDLASRLAALEAMMGTSSGGPVRSVDTISSTSILRLNADGRLSNIPVTGAGALQVTNYVQTVQPNTLTYTFSGAGLLTTTPHQLYIGGQKLIETVDYTPSSSVNGMITLTSQPDLSSNPTNTMEQLMIELSIWSL